MLRGAFLIEKYLVIKYYLFQSRAGRALLHPLNRLVLSAPRAL